MKYSEYIPEGYPEWGKAVAAFKSGDKAGALFILKKLAGQGCIEACCEVGNLYEIGGGGIDQDYQKAKQWYEKAIYEAGDSVACVTLGHMYLTGKGCDVDYGKAYYYFDFLKEESQCSAIFALGLMNELGLGRPKNYDAALAFYKEAFDAGHVTAMTRYGRLNIKLHRYITGFKYFFKGVFSAIKLMRENPNDWRLKIR